MASRDEKQQRKIEKTLKTLKSSRKFHSGEVLEESTSENQQPDEDDYGYASTYSEQIHKKLMQQYSSMPEDKKFSSSLGKSRITTKDDVQKLKNSLCSKEEEQNFRTGSTQRKSHSTSSGKPSTSGGNLYQPEKPVDKPKPKHRPAPIVDFQALMKLAEQKQHEEIEIEVPSAKKKEERLLTSKEKREQEEAEAYRRGRIERMKLAKKGAAAGGDKNNNNSADKRPPAKLDDDARKQKMKVPPVTATTSNGRATDKAPLKPATSKLQDSRSQAAPSSSSAAMKSTNSTKLKPSVSSSTMKSRELGKPLNSSNKPSTSAMRAPTKPTTNNSKVPERTREFPPKDLQPKARDFPPKDLMRAREFPPKDLMRAREFPPKDLMRSREFPPRDMKPLKARGKPSFNVKKRELDEVDVQRNFFLMLLFNLIGRIEDEDSEYDSEMDDFIDDADADVDISAEIRNIFGYDKSR